MQSPPPPTVSEFVYPFEEKRKNGQTEKPNINSNREIKVIQQNSREITKKKTLWQSIRKATLSVVDSLISLEICYTR